MRGSLPPKESNYDATYEFISRAPAFGHVKRIKSDIIKKF
jgi:hypothetical protein